jgi:hypothetical protein
VIDGAAFDVLAAEPPAPDMERSAVFSQAAVPSLESTGGDRRSDHRGPSARSNMVQIMPYGALTIGTGDIPAVFPHPPHYLVYRFAPAVTLVGETAEPRWLGGLARGRTRS